MSGVFGGHIKVSAETYRTRYGNQHGSYVLFSTRDYVTVGLMTVTLTQDGRQTVSYPPQLRWIKNAWYSWVKR